MNTLTHFHVVATSAIFALATTATAVSPKDIVPEKELLITHPAVVDSELARFPGPWSFGKLMGELSGNDGREFVRDWLDSMAKPQSVVVGPPPAMFGYCAPAPTVTVPARPNFTKLIIEPWQRRDGYDPKSTEPWLPKLENAPFRLLAIVNRMDLGASGFVDFRNAEFDKWRLFGKEEEFKKLVAGSFDGVPFNRQPRPSGISAFGPGGDWGSSKATDGVTVGEGRLVFGALSESGSPLPGGWTLIFEYKLRLPPGFDLLGAELVDGKLRAKDISESVLMSRIAFEWAKQWHALSELDLTDHRFPLALERLTRCFTNGRMALAQLRSNDGACGMGREFRQYELNNDKLTLQRLPGTPAPAFMDKNSREARALTAFLREQTPLIRAGIGNLPASLQDRGKSIPLSAAVAYVPDNNPSFHWDLAAPRETRRLFSLSTCNGCHAGETATITGMHIQPRSIGEASRISEWLGAGKDGIRLDDPGFKNTRVDLREMQDRKTILAAFLTPRESSRMNALREVLRDRLSRTH